VNGERPAPPQDRPTRNITTDADDSTALADKKPGTAVLHVPCTAPPAAQDTRSQIRRRQEAARRLPPWPGAVDCASAAWWRQ